MHGHIKTRLFSLAGRRIVLHKPYNGCTEGMIVEQIGPARFGCHLQFPDGHVYMSGVAGRPVTVDFHRAEFKLPPLPQSERRPLWLDDDSEGFTYADIPNFSTWRACYGKAK